MRYEDPHNNKRYFYQLDGEGLRYELLSFLKTIRLERDFNYVAATTSEEIVKVLADFYARHEMTVI